MDLRIFYLAYAIPSLWILTVFFCIALLFVEWKHVFNEFSKVRRLTWVLLVAIIIAAGIVRFFLVPTMHLLYIDEHLYIDSAKNIISSGQSVNCRFEGTTLCLPIIQKAPGWPFLLSLAFRLFGDSPHVALTVTKIVALLVIFASFLFSYLIFRNQAVGLWAGFILALSPLHAQWSNTVEAAIPSLLAVILTLLSCMLFLKLRQGPLGALTAILLLFSALIRYENVILLPIVALLIVLGTDIFPKKLKNAVHLFSPSIFVGECLLEILAIFQGLDFFRPHLSLALPSLYMLQFPWFIQTVSGGYLLLFPAIFGAVSIWRERLFSSVTLFPLVFFSLLYLPLSSETRMLIVPFFFVAILGAYGVERFFSHMRPSAPLLFSCRLAMLLLITLAAKFSPYPLEHSLRDRSGLYSLEYSSTASLHSYVPGKCFIVSEYAAIPTAVTVNRGIKTNYALSHPQEMGELLGEGNCIYYFQDMYCSLKEGNFGRDCATMENLYSLSLIETFSNDYAQFNLYRMDGLKVLHP